MPQILKEITPKMIYFQHIFDIVSHWLIHWLIGSNTKIISYMAPGVGNVKISMIQRDPKYKKMTQNLLFPTLFGHCTRITHTFNQCSHWKIHYGMSQC